MSEAQDRPTQRLRQLTSLGGLLGMVLSGAVIVAIPACVGPVTVDDTARIEHACSSCHGINGISISSNFPRLAGQQKDYLVNQLKTFEDQSRADPNAHVYMWGMAKGLGGEIIDRLATDYAAMTPAPGTPGDPADVAAGKIIYENGIVENEVPACVRCHGKQAQGAEAYPRLAGQHRAYLERQLGYFSANARVNKTMHQNSKNLTEAQIRQLATYLAAQ